MTSPLFFYGFQATHEGTPISDAPFIGSEAYFASRGHANPLPAGEIDFSKFEQPVDAFTIPDRAETIEIFRMLAVVSSSLTSTTEIAKNNECENRYTDVAPYDSNLYTLPCLSYYNASPIEAGGVKYVAAQGPMERNVSVFWNLVLGSEASVAVTTTNAEERGFSKCEPWWEEEYLPEGVQLESETVEAEQEGEQVVRRVFTLPRTERKLTQLHYVGWPDKGVPHVKLFLSLLKLVNTHYVDSDKPIVAHCSAGCGRTGVFIAVHSLLRDIANEVESVNVPHRIFDMRRQRMHLVQRPLQLQAVYATIAHHLESREESLSEESEEVFFLKV